MALKLIISFFAIAILSSCAHTSMPSSENSAVIIYPVFDKDFSCSEHWEGQLEELGDALGSDCIIQDYGNIKGRSFSRAYLNDGSRNEDWFGWKSNVLAPMDSVVESVSENTRTNQPGVTNPGSASSITFVHADGTRLIYAHVVDIQVKPGQKVLKGQVVGKVGNNGWASNPHIHIGAWKDGVPLQIRFDLHEMGRIHRTTPK